MEIRDCTDTDVPVGSCELLWNGPKVPEVRAVFDCPEINGLQVWPPHHQGWPALPE